MQRVVTARLYVFLNYFSCDLTSLLLYAYFISGSLWQTDKHADTQRNTFKCPTHLLAQFFHSKLVFVSMFSMFNSNKTKLYVRRRIK